MPRHNEAPLFATQGGGYATYVNGKYVWHSEIPEFMDGARVGDPIPEEWDIVAVNDAAREVLEEDQDDLTLFGGPPPEYFYESTRSWPRPPDPEDPYGSGPAFNRAFVLAEGNETLARQMVEGAPNDW